MFGAYTKDFGDCFAAWPALALRSAPGPVSSPHVSVCVYVSGACLFQGVVRVTCAC